MMTEELSLLDHYLVLRSLGKGATAKVKAIEDPVTHQIFAAKIMKHLSQSLTLKFRSMMQNEIQSLERIKHPNIVNMIKASEEGVYIKKKGKGVYNCMYIVMEFCPNGELFDLLYSTGKLSERIARFYFKQILNGLAACHSLEIAHRDLKPENILFDKDFNLKIADFGFSTFLMGRDNSGVLHTPLGTIGYMAPEIISKAPYIGESVDLFAVGVILFVMISHSPPFTKADSNDAHYRLFTTASDRFWAMHSRGKVPDFYSFEFKSLITSMLALDPSRRLNMQGIKEHPWVNGPTASPEKVKEEISGRRAMILQAAEEAKSRRNSKTGVVHQGGRYYRGDVSESDNLTLSFNVQDEDTPVKLLSAGDASHNKYLQILTGLVPKEIMTILSNELGYREANCKTTLGSYNLKVSLVTETDCLRFKITLYRTLNDLYILDFSLIEGSHFEMMNFIKEITQKIDEMQLS